LPACSALTLGKLHRLVQRLDVHVAVPDLAAAFQLKREDPLERAEIWIVVDGHADHLAVNHVDKRVAARDDLELVPLVVHSGVRLNERRGRLGDGSDPL